MFTEDFEAMGPAPAMAAGEYVIWKGKPKKSAYIADKALSMLPIAIFWLIFDLNFLRMAGGNGFLLMFLLVHMMPVWLWLGNAVTSVIQWRNEDYYITNKRVIIRKGVFKPQRQTVFLRDVTAFRSTMACWTGSSAPAMSTSTMPSTATVSTAPPPAGSC